MEIARRRLKRSETAGANENLPGTPTRIDKEPIYKHSLRTIVKTHGIFFFFERMAGKTPDCGKGTELSSFHAAPLLLGFFFFFLKLCYGPEKSEK
jgi:hypothetical protein